MTNPDPNSFNNQLIADFRASGGNLTTGPFAGSPLILLTTTGAKSGQKRTTPLVHTRDGGKYVIIASKAGAPTNPDWYHNILKNPTVTIEVGAEKFEATASVAEPAERDRLYAAQAALMPNVAEYETKTDRKIPVVVLERI